MDFQYLMDNTLKQVQDWNFKTRTNKKDFWSFILVLIVINILSSIIFRRWLPMVNNIIGLAINIVSIPIAIRRCHDVNKSGWAYGVPILILVGMLLLMAILGGASFMALVTSGGAATGASLASLGSAAVVGLLLVPVAIGILIYYIVIFTKDSHPEKNQWGEVPASSKAAKPVETKK